MSSEPVGSEESVDPLVVELHKQKRDTEEWHRRVREWQETVDAPLDRLLPEWSAAWNDLTETWRLCWNDENSIDTVSEKLIRVAEQIRALEAIRTTGSQWHVSGRFGHFGVSTVRLDWCRNPQALTEGFHIGDPHGFHLPRAFRVACRIIDLSLTNAKSELTRKLRDLEEIPESCDAALWLPFLGSILPPLNSSGYTSLSFNPEDEASEIQLAVDGVSLPEPSSSLTTDEIMQAVRYSLWAVGRMDGKGFDEVRSRLFHRIDPTPKRKSIAIEDSSEITSDPSNSAPVPLAKRSTVRGEGRAKLIAALIKHHRYADDGCLNTEPMNNNELARLASVDKATASAFFKKEFRGHTNYKKLCQDVNRLADSLKYLNGEFTPYILFGRNPPGEDDRDDR